MFANTNTWSKHQLNVFDHESVSRVKKIARRPPRRTGEEKTRCQYHYIKAHLRIKPVVIAARWMALPGASKGRTLASIVDPAKNGSAGYHGAKS